MPDTKSKSKRTRALARILSVVAIVDMWAMVYRHRRHQLLSNASGKRTFFSQTKVVSIALVLVVVLANLVTQSYTLQVNAASPLVYDTDFTNVAKQDTHHLNMGQIADYFAFGGDGGGASMWMEGLDRNTPGITCHSGSRCVGMELTNITKSRRAEFNIMNLQNLVKNELFVSVWLYLPADWNLHSGHDDWYEIVNPFFTGDPTYNPYTAVHIYPIDNISPSAFHLSFDGEDSSGTFISHADYASYSLPRGQWFNVQYYVYRDVSNGIDRVWIDGNLIFDVSGFSTQNPSISAWFTTPAKIYYSTADTFTPYRIWVDDLEIYNTQPQTSSSTSSSTTSSTTTSATSTSSSTTTSSTITMTSSTITTTSNSTSYLVVKRRQ